MCIGTPMLVVDGRPDQAVVEGRGRRETIDTRLVGDCVPGEWLLVFQGAARERLAAQRAAEIDAALDLLEAGMAGDFAAATADPGFVLPSSMSAEQLAALTASPRTTEPALAAPAELAATGDPR